MQRDNSEIVHIPRWLSGRSGRFFACTFLYRFFGSMDKYVWVVVVEIGELGSSSDQEDGDEDEEEYTGDLLGDW